MSGSTGYPQTVFYPSMVVNLQLRFDEGLTLISGATTPESLAGANSLPVQSAQPVKPSVLAKGRDNLTQIIGIVPKVCGVDLPGYRQAATFSLVMSYRDLPLDPRVIRAIGVAIHLDAVPAGEWGDGMVQSPDLRQPSGRRSSIITTSEDNLLFAGLVDNLNVDYSTQAITMDGRDLRGMLLDTPISAATLQSIDLNQSIDKVVSHIVQDLHPQGAGIEVVVQASEWPNGVIPSPATFDDITRVNLDATGSQLKAAAKGEAEKVNFWDLITQYSFMVGGVPYFAGSKLRIRPARNLYDARRQDDERTFDARAGTPFKNGAQRSVRPPLVSEPETFGFRRFVIGKDVQSLNFERKLTGVTVPVIECVSVDTSSKERGKDKLLKVQWPSAENAEARTTKVGVGGVTPSTDILRINVPGIKNKDRLLEIAQDLFQEIGRQEMGGKLETKNLASFGGSNQDPDTLRLRPGDAVELRVDATGQQSFPPPISEVTNLEEKSFEGAVKAVQARVGDENLARVLVAVNRGQVAELQRQFRVGNVRFDWNSDSGVGIAFDFQNYLEARYTVG